MNRALLLMLALRKAEGTADEAGLSTLFGGLELDELSDDVLLDAARGAPIEPGDFAEPLLLRVRSASGEELKVDGFGAPALQVEERAADGEAQPGTTLFVGSTATPDRAMDVVNQRWRLKNWRDNPVIFDNHNPYRVVGKGLDAKVPRVGDDSGKLMIRVAWNLESPDATIAAVGHDHLNGFRKAGSVGFKSWKKTPRNKLPADHFAHQDPVEVETWWGGTVEMAGTFLDDNELYEFSSASIPMNPEALQRSLVDHLASLDPADAAGRARSHLPVDVARGVLELLQSAEHRAPLMDLLWPDLLDRARTDVTFRRILRASLEQGPPAEPLPSLATLVVRALEKSQ